MLLDEPDVAILIDVLARTDALWGCPRVHSNPATGLPGPAWAAVSEKRAAFPLCGVDFVFTGTIAEHKANERRIGSLASAGLLVVCGRAGRRVGLRLTDRGDDNARWQAAATMRHQAWPWLEVIALFVQAGISRHEWVREVDLARVDYGQPEVSAKLSDLELSLLPLKAARLVDDHADVRGRVWYSLTAAGREAVEDEPPGEPDLPPYQASWGEQHTALERQYLQERLSWRPNRPGHVVVPLSAGLGPSRSWRDVLGATQ